MSDMPVCLVTPRSSTQTKAGPTPFWSDGPKWPAETLRRDGAPGLKAESAPPDLLSKRSLLSPVLLLLLLKTQCPFNPSSIPSLATPNLQSTPPHSPSETLTHTFPLFLPHVSRLGASHAHARSPPLGLSPPRPPGPSTHLGCLFNGCVFHAPVAGQALGDFPRWGLKVGQRRAVMSEARLRLCVSCV